MQIKLSLNLIVFWLFCLQLILLLDFYAKGRHYYTSNTFLAHKQSKTLKSSIEKFSELVIKGRIRLCQLSGTHPTEVIIPFTNAEIMSL